MKKFRNEAITITTVLFTILSMTINVYADAAPPPTKVVDEDLILPILVIIIVCVIALFKIKNMRRKK